MPNLLRSLGTLPPWLPPPCPPPPPKPPLPPVPSNPPAPPLPHPIRSLGKYDHRRSHYVGLYWTPRIDMEWQASLTPEYIPNSFF